MQLEDYFDFLSPNEIKIKGHRIFIEDVLYEYIHRAQTFEELVKRFETLTKEEILAVLLYYHHNKEAMNKYLADWLEYCRVSREQNLRENAERNAAFRRRVEEMKAKKSQAAS